MSQVREILRICGISVDDAKSSLPFVNDIGVLEKALQYEIEHGNRKAMIWNIKARIRRLEKKRVNRVE